MTASGVAAFGLLLSFMLLALMRPQLPGPWRWNWRGLAIHAGLWCVGYAALLMLLGRPWFSLGLALAFVMLLVQVSNAKYLALREAFVFQDFEYFTDAIRHPRLYIPFLGWGKFAAIVVVVVAALLAGLWLEPVVAGRFSGDGVWREALVLSVLGGALLFAGHGKVELTFDPVADLARWGFFACLWFYGVAERVTRITGTKPLAAPYLERVGGDLLVVQSESFFDPRSLFDGIRPDVLAAFDRVSAQSAQHGPLDVPAWGANTVRSEFAFLSGLPASKLGVHRFNPYRSALRGEMETLAKRAKAAGYRTLCVHPYPASFYRRDRVFPHFGFDEFIDISAFADAPRCGPFVADITLGERVKALFNDTGQPLFVFVITMENHGPLHLEHCEAADIPELYDRAPPVGCDDLTVYLKHLRNADLMLGDLRDFLVARGKPARFCWYGDHVPIMASVYRQLGEPNGDTAYFIWDSNGDIAPAAIRRPLHQLATVLVS